MKTAFLIQGLAYGDEGKGQTVDYIVRTRSCKAVIRFCGGPQSSHNVCTEDGRHHTFSQFGSGSFVPGVKTHLSRFMLVNPLNMMNEAVHLEAVGIKDIFERTTVDEKCLIVTPFQKAVNRILAGRRKNTCGQGVGAARLDHSTEGDKVLFAADFANKSAMKSRLRFLQDLSQRRVNNLGTLARTFAPEEWKLLYDPDAVDRIAKQYAECPMQVVSKFELPKENIVFEGAQGVLLDEVHGDLGFNTWTNTTFENALKLLEESGWSDRVTKIGVIRTYLTRHGEGPFRTEDPALDNLEEPHNCEGCYQGKFRRGHFDARLIAHAIDICGGVNGIALNHCDVMPGFESLEVKAGSRYDYPRVVIRGSGPTAKEREWLI